MPVHLIVASAAFLCAVSGVGACFLVRLLFLRRLEQIGDIEPIYGRCDMPPAVLWKIRNHTDSQFEFGAEGEDWRIGLKCRGRMRLFLWVHAYYMAEFAWQRLAEEKRFPFVWWHTMAMGLLCCLASVKILVWPSPDDVAALVGFDSITAEKLTEIKAALEQREDAHID